MGVVWGHEERRMEGQMMWKQDQSLGPNTQSSWPKEGEMSMCVIHPEEEMEVPQRLGRGCTPQPVRCKSGSGLTLTCLLKAKKVTKKRYLWELLGGQLMTNGMRCSP